MHFNCCNLLDFSFCHISSNNNIHGAQRCAEGGTLSFCCCHTFGNCIRDVSLHMSRKHTSSVWLHWVNKTLASISILLTEARAYQKQYCCLPFFFKQISIVASTLLFMIEKAICNGNGKMLQPKSGELCCSPSQVSFLISTIVASLLNLLQFRLVKCCDHLREQVWLINFC